MGSANSQTLLEVTGLCKSYAGAAVLSSVDLALGAGEVHAIIGENGAGKSTLARILSGLVSPDAGEMKLLGDDYRPHNKRNAQKSGVRIVLQELNTIGTLSVAESIFLDRLPRKLGIIDYRELHRQTRILLDQIGLTGVAPDRPMQTLGIGQQQTVEIAAALSEQCRVLILDEPTAALSTPEIENLFEQIDRLRSNGTAILYVSHRMEEITRICDKISVLRDGCLVATGETTNFQLGELISLMVGRKLGHSAWRAKPRGDLAMQVRNLRNDAIAPAINFELYRGEILGVAGLMGSGRTEMLRAIFGADNRSDGDILLRGSDTPAYIRSPRDAIKQGVALVTEDRKGQGLLLSRTIRENITLTRLADMARYGGWIRAKVEANAVDKLSRSLGVRCRSMEQTAGELSGGNQQKVVLAKWINCRPDVLLLDEPTRGIDIGARFEIYALLNDMAEQGKAILLVSSDMLELMGLCDRLVVMAAGRISATFSRDEWSADKIMAAALEQSPAS